jgi:hypothetical protein
MARSRATGASAGPAVIQGKRSPQAVRAFARLATSSR